MFQLPVKGRAHGPAVVPKAALANPGGHGSGDPLRPVDRSRRSQCGWLAGRVVSALVEDGVAKVLREDIKDVAAGKMGHSTQAVGDLVVDYIEKS